MTRPADAGIVLRYPWLLPFIAVLMRGPSSIRGITDELGCSRRLAASGLHKLRILGVVDKVGEGVFYIKGEPRICILRYKRWFIALHGATYIIAKVRKTGVKAYTLPAKLLEGLPNGTAPGRLRYRVEVARYILSTASPYAGCGGAEQGYGRGGSPRRRPRETPK